MKKVLIGLLVLAVAGGGVFAQEWQFNGEMRAGLGLFLLEDDDDPRVGMVSEATGNMRADLRTRVQNADGTAGLDFLFRSEGEAGVSLNYAFGWLNFMDNMLTLQGGRIDDAAGFNSFDRMTGSRMGEGSGLRVLVRPMDGLVLNFGAFTNHSDSGLGLVYVENDAPATDLGQLRAVFAVRYEEPGLFRLVAGGRTANEADGPSNGFDGWLLGAAALNDLFGLEAGDEGFFTGNPWTPANRDRSSAAYFSFEYLGLNDDGIHLSASAFFLNLEEFGDYGIMFYYASFGHTGLVDGMDLRANVGFGLSQNDAHDDFYLWVWGSVDYQLNDWVVPRLDLHYVMGGASNGALRNMHHRDVARGGATFHEDFSFVRIQPSVQLRIQANTFVELGCIFHIDLGDAPTWGNGNGTNIAAYALMRVSF